MSFGATTAGRRPALGWPLGIASVCLICGGSIAWFPLPTLLIVLTVVVVVAAYRIPGPTIIVCLALLALHYGFFLRYRLTAAGAPVSVLDAIPVTLLIAAISLRRSSGELKAGRPLLLLVFALFTGGLVLGAAHGLLARADVYELIRVVRIEIVLLVVLASAALAGQVPAWREAVTRGLYLAGVVVAGEYLVSYLFLTTHGYDLWEQLGIQNVSVPSSEISGYISTYRDIDAFKFSALPGYLMLPTLCIALTRARRSDVAATGLILVAAAVSFSRGLTVAVVGTAIAALAMRVTWSRGELGGSKAAGIAAVLAITVVGIVMAFGGAIGVNLSNTGSSADASATLRRSETEAALTALSRDPINLVFGVGAGVTIPYKEVSSPTALLENQLLARWTNLTLLSVIATMLLLLGAAHRGLRLARSRKQDRSIYAATLALPIIGLAGLVGGTLLSAQLTVPFWLLAGTVLADPTSAWQARRTSVPSNSTTALKL